jgi:MtN3 and saliva related transmembrane protein
MMDTYAQIFGWTASFFTTIIFLPQLLKALKTKLTDDISMGMLVLSVLGNSFWFAHAFLMLNWPLLVCALLIIIISITLILFKHHNEKSAAV